MIDSDVALTVVTRIPRTTTEMYREWAGLAEDDNMTASRRHARRRLGHALERLAREGVIQRGIIEGDGHRPWVCFWREDLGAGDSNRDSEGPDGETAGGSERGAT